MFSAADTCCSRERRIALYKRSSINLFSVNGVPIKYLVWLTESPTEQFFWKYGYCDFPWFCSCELDLCDKTRVPTPVLPQSEHVDISVKYMACCGSGEQAQKKRRNRTLSLKQLVGIIDEQQAQSIMPKIERYTDTLKQAQKQKV